MDLVVGRPPVDEQPRRQEQGAEPERGQPVLWLEAGGLAALGRGQLGLLPGLLLDVDVAQAREEDDADHAAHAEA